MLSLTLSEYDYMSIVKDSFISSERFIAQITLMLAELLLCVLRLFDVLWSLCTVKSFDFGVFVAIFYSLFALELF